MAAKSCSSTRAKRFLVDYAGFLTSCGLPTRSSDFDRLPLNKATQLRRKIAEHFRSEVMTARPDLHDAEVMKRRIALIENVALRQLLSAQLDYQPAPIALAFQAYLERVGTNLASRFRPRLTACDTKKNSRRQIREFILGLVGFDASLPWYRELASVEETDLHDIVERALYERIRSSDWQTRITFVITSVFDAVPQQSERIVSALLPGSAPTPADVDVIEDRIIHAAASKPNGEYTLFAVCAGIGWGSLAEKCQESALGARSSKVEGSSPEEASLAEPANEVTTTSFLVRDYRDFLDDYAIRTTVTDFKDCQGMSSSEEVRRLASHFSGVVAMPVRVDWNAEVAKVPASALRDALASGLAQRTAKQSWWDQARFLLAMVVPVSSPKHERTLKTIRNANPNRLSDRSLVEQQIVTATPDASWTANLAEQAGWHDLATALRTRVEPVNPSGSNENPASGATTETASGATTETARAKAASGHTPQTGTESTPEAVKVDHPHETIRRASWIEQARFVISTTFGTSNETARQLQALANDARDGDVTDKLRFTTELKKAVRTDVTLRGELQTLCRKIGWGGVANALNPGTDSTESRPAAASMQGSFERALVANQHTSTTPEVSNPCAVVLLSREVRTQVNNQFRSPGTDIRLDFPTHFLAEEFTIHKHWRLHLGGPITVDTHGAGKHQVSTIDIQVTGHRISIEMLNENGTRCQAPDAHIDHLGISSAAQRRNRYKEPFRRLAIIALIHAFGDSNLVFLTRTKAKLNTAKSVVGWKLTATEWRVALVGTAGPRRWYPDSG